ncbi:MAG TPA: cytochrome P450 [Solirubrobacteraceae bacterium]|nr:cytochrome P450 [Solirubrobacteraceae bacterium]
MSSLQGHAVTDETFAFDPWDVSWRDGRTVETIDELVEHHPLYGLPDGQYVLSRYDDVRDALKDEGRFSAAPNQSLIGFPPTVAPDTDPALLERLMQSVSKLPFDVTEFASAEVIVGIDGPAHRRIRNIVNRGFVPRRIQSLQPRIESIVADCLAGLDGADEFELMSQIAVPVPIRTVADLLGVPERSADLKRWSDVLSTCVHGEIRGTIDAAISLIEMLSEFAELFMPLIEARRSAPGEDVISDIVRATEVDTLSVAEAVLFLLIIMAAANETTTSMIGNAVPYLCDNRDQLAALQRDPELLDGTIEETLRLCVPVQFVFRQLREPEPMHGKDIPAGTVMVCLIAAASRDPRQFPDPHRFDITRPGLRHANLAFGHGAHHCLGAALGRLEGRAALQALIPYLDRYDVDRSDLHLDRSAFTRAYERVRMVRTAG